MQYIYYVTRDTKLHGNHNGKSGGPLHIPDALYDEQSAEGAFS